MQVQAFLDELTSAPEYRGQLTGVVRLPPHPGQWSAPTEPLPAALLQGLLACGVERLYSHQAKAVDAVRRGENVIVVTGTASGKSLCYHIPVLEAMVGKPESRALYLFPTKALAQDQLRGLLRLSQGVAGLTLLAGTYDGDTPEATRRRLRESAQCILTNPDMLHSGILPRHAQWSEFFGNLRYIIMDEIHVYRGIFGSHVANVLRRLLRICSLYGACPQFLCASATIGNPADLAQRLTGKPFTLIDEDGSPRGARYVVLWNPPRLGQTLERRSSTAEAVDLLVRLVRRRIPTIAFTRTRMGAELLYRYTRDRLQREIPSAANAIRAYRGGYLPEERREIERQLFAGELLAVASTNALELGIDVGALEAAVLVGYPGSIASMWQQIGRAGRSQDEALAVLVAQNSPLDQYLVQHPDYLFRRLPEQATIDPDNPHVVLAHLRAAIYELPLDVDEEKQFGPLAPQLLDLLAEQGEIDLIGRRWHWRGRGYPATDFSLRGGLDVTYTIVDTTHGSAAPPGWTMLTPPTAARWGRRESGFSEAGFAGWGPQPYSATIPRTIGRSTAKSRASWQAGAGNRVIGTVDEVSAFTQLHPEAIYLHDGETFYVERLDLSQRVAYVSRADVDYYTQSISDRRVRIETEQWHRTSRGADVAFGDVSIDFIVYMFKKIRFDSRESIGYGRVDLPSTTLRTAGMWVTPPACALEAVCQYDLNPIDGLLGIANVFVEVLPLFALSDPQDVGAVVDPGQTGGPTLFIYDRYPGGTGFAQRAYESLEEILEACCELIHGCRCQDGCPSCVGAPLPVSGCAELGAEPGHIPDREAALVLLHVLLGKEAYVPRRRGPISTSPELVSDSAFARIAARPGVGQDASDPVDQRVRIREQADRPPRKPLPGGLERRLREQLAQLKGR